VNGIKGILTNKHVTIDRETFLLYNNLGGIDYIGRKYESLRTEEELKATVKVCKELDLTGLVLVGSTHTLTDGVFLSQYLMTQGLSTRVIVVPATVDGNIHHNYLEATVGFDTTSKIYSQLIGNMLTDSASATKYWYFIRLMGKEPSHLALECAHQTRPNIVIVSEEAQDRNYSLNDIVNLICDAICERAASGKNFGCVLIPEGLLEHVSTFKQLILELNRLFNKPSQQV